MSWSTFRQISKSLTYMLPPTYQVKTKRNKTCVSQVEFLSFFCIIFFAPSIKDRGSLQTLDKQEMFYDSMYLASKATSWQSFLRSIEWWIWQTKALKLFHFIRLCPKCSANPITVTPIWKWEFQNREHPLGVGTWLF